MAETIYALATSPLVARSGSGIAVLRVSGPAALLALHRIAGAGRQPQPRLATLSLLRDPVSGQPIDRGLVLWFGAPQSVTGEDYTEFHVHGGRAVIAAMLQALAAVPGCRLALPGEFARRSFANGKLDLTAVEGIADLVAAETEAQRRQALRQLEGELGRLYDGWRERLMRALAHLEAAIDFPDEDLPQGIASDVMTGLGSLHAEIVKHLAERRGERLRDGFCVAILGRPNVGKSSLLNRLARREAAIVSPYPGTTRDVVEVHLDLAGYPVMLVDTAGLRESNDAIEQEGVRRALERAARADIRLLVHAVDSAGSLPVLSGEAEILGPAVCGHAIEVLNKVDLLAGSARQMELRQEWHGVLAVSATTGEGIDELADEIRRHVERMLAPEGTTPNHDILTEPPPLTNHRHREALTHCAEALQRGVQLATVDAEAPELLAEDVRIAARSLGRITGRVDVEDILDIIFRDFCIGK